MSNDDTLEVGPEEDIDIDDDLDGEEAPTGVEPGDVDESDVPDTDPLE